MALPRKVVIAAVHPHAAGAAHFNAAMVKAMSAKSAGGASRLATHVPTVALPGPVDGHLGAAGLEPDAVAHAGLVRPAHVAARASAC